MESSIRVPKMDDLEHPTATDSFSQNWLQTTYAPFEFSYTRSESETAEHDDQSSVGIGSFNFGTQLPHWFQLNSDDDGDVQLYADDLFYNGFIKTPLHQSSSPDESESLFIVKPDKSSVSSSPVSEVKCRVLRKWGMCAKNVVIKWWKVVECGLKSKKKAMGRSDLRAWPSGRQLAYGHGCVENPIYEAVLHCKRSSMGDHC